MNDEESKLLDLKLDENKAGYGTTKKTVICKKCNYTGRFCVSGKTNDGGQGNLLGHPVVYRKVFKVSLFLLILLGGFAINSNYMLVASILPFFIPSRYLFFRTIINHGEMFCPSCREKIIYSEELLSKYGFRLYPGYRYEEL